jgi:hypothetical protein
MTANELADRLQNEKAKTLLYVATIVDSANMLRQQQAEIESLKPYKEKIEMMERAYDAHIKKSMGEVKDLIKKASKK